VLTTATAVCTAICTAVLCVSRRTVAVASTTSPACRRRRRRVGSWATQTTALMRPRSPNCSYHPGAVSVVAVITAPVVVALAVFHAILELFLVAVSPKDPAAAVLGPELPKGAGGRGRAGVWRTFAAFTTAPETGIATKATAARAAVKATPRLLPFRLLQLG